MSPASGELKISILCRKFTLISTSSFRFFNIHSRFGSRTFFIAYGQQFYMGLPGAQFHKIYYVWNHWRLWHFSDHFFIFIPDLLLFQPDISWPGSFYL